MVALMNAINQVIKRGKSKFAHNDFIYSSLKILKGTTKMIWFCFFVQIDHEEFHYLYHNFKWCLLFWWNI